MAMNKFTGRTDCRVAEYSVTYVDDELSLVSVKMRFCAGEKMEIDIEPELVMTIDLDDRRLSHVFKIIDGNNKVLRHNNKEYKMIKCDWTIVKNTLGSILPGVIDYEIAPDVQCRQGHSVFDIFYHTVNGDKMHLIYHANVKTRTLGHINEIINCGNNKHLMFDANNKPIYAANIGCYASSMADLLSPDDYCIYCDEMDAKSGIREQIETFAHTWISDSAEITARDDESTPGIHRYMVGEYELSGEDGNGFEIYSIVKEYPYEFLVHDAYDDMYVRNTDTGEQSDKFDFDALMALDIDIYERVKWRIINYISDNAAIIIKPSNILLIDGDDADYYASVCADNYIFRMSVDVGLCIIPRVYYVSYFSQDWHHDIDNILRMIRLRAASPEDVAGALSGLTHLEAAHTLELMGYKLHHGAQAAGYVKKHDGASVSPYNGCFGSGYCLHYPSRRSTAYHYCEYWLA